MHLVFDIFQGIGVAAAVGIRPFLPALAVGALAAGDIQIDFDHTGFAFLQQPVFLAIMVVGTVLLAGLERRLGARTYESRLIVAVLAVVALIIGALMFGGAIDRSHNPAWIGIVAGVLCAGVGLLATRPLLARVRTRLDAETAGVLPFITEAVATLGAALSVIAPPVGVIVLAGLLWLLVAGRARTEQKYAGLRILR